MITVESLTRRYAGFIAVDNVSFAVKPGRVTGFPGPNGAGKSTTMRVTVGLTARTSGWATIDGVRFAGLGGSWATSPPASSPTPASKSAVLENDWRGHVPQISVSVLFWVAVPLAAGVVRTIRRDVT